MTLTDTGSDITVSLDSHPQSSTPREEILTRVLKQHIKNYLSDFKQDILEDTITEDLQKIINKLKEY